MLYLRGLVSLIVITFAGSLLFYGIYLFGVSHENPECMENALPHLHSKNNSLETKSLASRQEKDTGYINGYTTHSIVFENSASPSENLKIEESIAKVMPRINSFKGRSKRHTRRKRNNPKEKSPKWQFNLNVTRFDNQTTGSQPKVDVTSDKLHLGKPRQHLESAIHVGGSDPEDSYRAWNSVESFLKHLFGGNVEELSEKGHGIFIDFNGLPSKKQTGDPANAESRSQPRDKEGKFLFGLFGFGVNSENPPIDQGSGEAFNHTNFTDPSIHDVKLSNNSTITESPLETNSSDEMEPTTKMSAILNNSTDIQLLKTTVTLKKFEVLDLVLEEESTIEDSNIFSTPLAEFSKDNLPTPSEKQQDTEIEGSVSAHGNELRSAAESRPPEISTVMTRNTNIVENSLIAEEFREFCITLLQRMQKSPRRLDDLNDIDGSGSLKENEASSVVATSQGQISTVQQRPQNLGLFANFLNRITGGRFRQESSADDIDSANTSVVLETDNQKAKIFNFNNLLRSFGSERSAQLNDFENIKFDDMDLTGEHDIERYVPSVSECEMFFSNIRHKNSSIEPNFEEALSLLDKTTESHSTESVQEKRFFSVAFGSNDTRSLILEEIEKQESFDNVDTIKDLISEPTTDRTSEKEGKIFNLFGFGNGLNIGSGSSEVAEEKERRILGSFKSGGRGITEDFLNDPNTGDQLISTVASQELRKIPGLLNFGNGERNLEESFPFEDNTFDATTNSERSFGGFSGDFGSGESQMQEKFGTASVGFPTSEILQFENANARELYTQDPTYSDFENYETDAKFVTTDSEIQTQLPKEHIPFSYSFGSEDALISATETDKEDRRFIGFLNLLGSGDGRELLETNEKSSDRTQPGCVVCTLENGTYPSIRCTECPLGTSPDIPLKMGTETDHYIVSEAASNVEPSNVESFGDSIPSSTDNEVIATSETESILIGKLFLSGNGESTDQINLVHETESTSLSSRSPSRSARRGRLDDEIPFDEKAESHLKDTVFNTIVESKNISEDLLESFNDAKKVTPHSINPALTEMSSKVEQISKQTEESEDGSLSPLPSNQNYIEPETVELGLSTTLTTRTLISRRDVKRRKRYCTGTSQCDASLNERCIVKGHGLFCDCGRHFVRHSETWRCEEPATVKTSLRFPEEVYHEDLRDDGSERFNLMRKDSIQTIKLFLSHDPELMAALAKVDITGFEEGSVVVESDLVFARSGRNQSVIEFVRRVHANLKEALEDEELLRKVPLNAEGAYLMAVSAVIHRCDTSELHNCSPDARCIPDGTDFRCQCNEGYLDNSRAGFAGEVCIEICPPDYCGDNGFCDLKSKGEKHCLCSGWYFGEKCQINGIVVIGGFAALNILAVLVIIGVVYFCRWRKYRRSQYYSGDNRSKVQEEESFGYLSAVPSRLQSNIAMDQFGVASTSKYHMTRSTPAHGPPTIHVTSPSVYGSSIDYDSDSTFDRTENVEDEAVRL